MRFSLMISVYNAEAFLRACLDSVLSQNYNDFEVILIDDGSTDSSDKICDSYAEKDRRVRVFHTENRGVFLARAYAESHAKGEYLLHLDADDTVEPTMLSALSNAIDAYAPDLLVFDFSTVRDGEPPVLESFGNEDRLFSENELSELYRLVFSTRFNTLCNKCFHRKLIAAAPDCEAFAGIRHGEDLLRSAYLIFACERVYYIRQSFYNYRLGVGNSCRFDPNCLEWYDRVLHTLYGLLCEKVEPSPQWDRTVAEMARKQLDNALRLLAGSKLSLAAGAALLRKASQSELWQRALSASPNSFKYRLLKRGQYRTLLAVHRGKRWLYAQ